MNGLQLQYWKHNNGKCPFCQSGNIEVYDSGYEGSFEFHDCVLCKDCGEEWEEIFETVLSNDFLCPICSGMEIIDGITVITELGFYITQSCDECNHYWETEFMLAGIKYEGQVYKVEDINDIYL